MVEILKLMYGRYSENEILAELNPRVRCAFGNVLEHDVYINFTNTAIIFFKVIKT